MIENATGQSPGFRNEKNRLVTTRGVTEKIGHVGGLRDQPGQPPESGRAAPSSRALIARASAIPSATRWNTPTVFARNAAAFRWRGRLHDYHAMNASVSRIARSAARQPRHRGTAWIGPTWPRPPSAAGTCRGPGRSPTRVSRAARGSSSPPVSVRPPLGAAVISANPRDERPYQGTEPPNCTTRWASPWTSFRCPISSPIETCLPEVIRTPRTSA